MFSCRFINFPPTPWSWMAAGTMLITVCLRMSRVSRNLCQISRPRKINDHLPPGAMFTSLLIRANQNLVLLQSHWSRRRTAFDSVSTAETKTRWLSALVFYFSAAVLIRDSIIKPRCQSGPGYVRNPRAWIPAPLEQHLESNTSAVFTPSMV